MLFIFHFQEISQWVNLVTQWEPLQLLYREIERSQLLCPRESVIVCVCVNVSVYVCLFNRHITGSQDFKELRGWAASQFLTYICGHTVKTLNSSDPADLRMRPRSRSFQQKSRLIQHLHFQPTNSAKMCVLLTFCGLFSISAVNVWACVRQTKDRCQTGLYAVF